MHHLAVVCDYREENWPSMDLVADMLLGQLTTNYSNEFVATRVCPPMRRRFSAAGADEGMGFNADRFLNRFLDYPRHLRSQSSEFDLFHVMDHSYGQLVRELPPARTIITCHDLDTFQCLLNPAQEPRSFLFRKMMARTLDGFRRAARVTCVSEATRAELLAHGLVEPERAVVVPNGVHPSCSPVADIEADRQAARLLGELLGESAAASVDILHVGSTIPRKRIDLLLRTFAAIRKELPTARLIRVGGSFTAEQVKLANHLDVKAAIVVLPQLERNVLAAVYRRAAVVLLPSDREGFGLPVVEALACGTPVVASDLPALHEVGGQAVVYCAGEDVSAWAATTTQLLNERSLEPELWNERRTVGISHSRKFSWTRYTDSMVDLYLSVLKGH